MRKQYLVPFKYLIEVDMEADAEEYRIKHKAIARAIEKFEQEFKGYTINDIAHSLAPIRLGDIKEI